MFISHENGLNLSIWLSSPLCFEKDRMASGNLNQFPPLPFSFPFWWGRVRDYSVMKGNSLHLTHSLSLRKKHIEEWMRTIFLVRCPNTNCFSTLFHVCIILQIFKNSLPSGKKSNILSWNVLLFKGKAVKYVYSPFYHMVR